MNLRYNVPASVGLKISTVAAVALLAACGGDDGNSGPNSATATPTPSPSPSATPTPNPVEYTTTSVPFGLTANRDFDVFGWDSWPASPAPSVVKLRWNASAIEYELSEAGNSEYARLRRRADSPINYDAFAANGSQLPFWVDLRATGGVPPASSSLGNARIFDNLSAKAYFAFGIATPTADIPVTGTLTCQFGEDEIGDGVIIFDFAAGTASGEVSPFWGTGGNPATYSDLAEVKYTPSEVPALSAKFGSNPENLLEARFYGAQASEIAVRSKGDVTGIMTGTCTG